MWFKILAALLGVAFSAPTDTFVSVTEDALGSYRLDLNAGDHTRSEERDSSGLVHGSYSFEDPEGKKHMVKYVAGVDGFIPYSEDVPVLMENPDVTRARDAHLATWEKTAATNGIWEELDHSQGLDVAGLRKAPGKYLKVKMPVLEYVKA